MYGVEGDVGIVVHTKHLGVVSQGHAVEVLQHRCEVGSSVRALVDTGRAELVAVAIWI